MSVDVNRQIVYYKDFDNLKSIEGYNNRLTSVGLTMDIVGSAPEWDSTNQILKNISGCDFYYTGNDTLLKTIKLKSADGKQYVFFNVVENKWELIKYKINSSTTPKRVNSWGLNGGFYTSSSTITISTPSNFISLDGYLINIQQPLDGNTISVTSSSASIKNNSIYIEVNFTGKNLNNTQPGSFYYTVDYSLTYEDIPNEIPFAAASYAMDALDCYLWDATSDSEGKTLGDLIEQDKYHIKDTLFITDKIRSTENPDTKIEITNNDYMSNHGNIIKNDIIKQYTRLVTIPNYELGGGANYKILSFDGNIKNNNTEDSQYGFSNGVKYNALKDKVNAKYFTAKPQVYPEIIYDTMSGGFSENECLQDTMGVNVDVQDDCVILTRSGYAAINIDFDSEKDIILIYRRQSGRIEQLSSIPVSIKDPIKTTYGGWVESTHKSKGLWGYLASDWYATPYLPKLNINYELTFNPIDCCVIKPKTGYAVYLNPTYNSDWWDNDSRGVLSKVELDNNLTLKSIIKTTTQNIEYTINESREFKWLSNEKFIVQHPIIFNWKATVPYINNNSNYTKIIDITLNSLLMTKGDITNNSVSIVPRFKSTFGSLPTRASFFKNSSGEIKTNLLDYYVVAGVTQESRIASIEWNHINGTYNYKKTTGVGNHDVGFSLSMNFENNDTTDSVAHSIVIWRNGLSALNE